MRRTPGPRRALLAGLGLVLLAAACNKGPAEEAIKAAEQALAGAPEVERYLPEEFAAVSQAVRDARASFAAGRYTDALRVVQPLPDRIAAAAEVATRRKAETAAAWAALAAELPARLAALAARLDALAAAGVAAARLEPSHADLAALQAAWLDAVSASERGETPRAVAAGSDVKAKAEALAGRLGLKPAGLSSASSASRAGVAEERP